MEHVRNEINKNRMETKGTITDEIEKKKVIMLWIHEKNGYRKVARM